MKQEDIFDDDKKSEDLSALDSVLEPLYENVRDPEEEFFTLAVLSVKMTHAEEVEDIAYC